MNNLLVYMVHMNVFAFDRCELSTQSYLLLVKYSIIANELLLIIIIIENVLIIMRYQQYSHVASIVFSTSSTSLCEEEASALELRGVLSIIWPQSTLLTTCHVWSLQSLENINCVDCVDSPPQGYLTAISHSLKQRRFSSGCISVKCGERAMNLQP